jgi:hypothetical protein
MDAQGNVTSQASGFVQGLRDANLPATVLSLSEYDVTERRLTTGMLT